MRGPPLLTQDESTGFCAMMLATVLDFLSAMFEAVSPLPVPLGDRSRRLLYVQVVLVVCRGRPRCHAPALVLVASAPPPLPTPSLDTPHPSHVP